LGYRDGVLREKGGYSDYWLFVSPEAMLTKDIAEDPAEQLIPRPISYEQFKTMPRFNPAFPQFGIEVPGYSFFENRVLYKYVRWSGNLLSTADSYRCSNGVLEVELLCPKEYYLYGFLYDEEEENSLPYSCTAVYEHYSESLYKVILTFSVPGPGYHKANIRVRPLFEEGSGHSIYKFYCFEESKAGPNLPRENDFQVQMLKERYPAAVSEMNYPGPGNPYYSFQVDFEPGTLIYVNVKGVGRDDPEDRIFYHYHTPGSKTYFVSLPPPGEYRLQVYAKTEGEPLFNDKIAVLRFSSPAEGPASPKEGLIHNRVTYFQNGAVLTDDNLSSSREDGYVVLSYEHPPDTEVRASIRDIRGNYKDPVTGQYYTTGNRAFNYGNGKTDIYLRPPSRERYRVFIRVKTRGDSDSTTIQEFTLDGSRYNTVPFPPDRLLLTTKEFLKQKIELIGGNLKTGENLFLPEEQLSEGGLDRVYQVRLKGPPGAEMRCFLIETDSSGDYREHPDGSSVKPGQHYTYHYDGETYTFLFSPGDPLHSGSRYRARIHMVVEGKNRLVAEFYLDPGLHAGTPVPPPGVISLKKPFFDAELEILRDNRTTAEQDGFFHLSLKHPESINLTSTIRDPRGDSKFPESGRHYTSDHRMYSYLHERRDIYFQPPGIETYSVFIYAAPEGESSGRTVAEFLMNGEKYADSPFPPPDTLFLRREFLEEGFRLLYSNIGNADEGEVYELRVQAPADTQMQSRMRNQENENMRGHYTAEGEGQVWILRFSAPGPGRYQGRFYRRDDGSSSVRGSFFVEDSRAGPEL
jgi:hypothetical protein